MAGFTDPLVDCKTCKARFRADKIEDAQCPQKPSKHPGEHTTCELTEPRLFNLMFKTFMGPVEESAAVVYLRPETAQGIYVNFLNVLQGSRQKVPFGIAQIGKAFRNEITPGNFIFRTREFEQMEMQFFVKPGADAEWFEHWRELRMAWYHALGLNPAKLRWHEHGPGELAHYAKAAYDIEYEFPFGWNEIEGIHNRTDFDLQRHQAASGKKLDYFDQAANERFVPYIVETSAGADRVTLTTLVDAYREEAGRGRDPRGARLPSVHRADQGGRLPAGQEGRDAGVRHAALPRPQAAGARLLRRQRGGRAALPAHGRGRHAVLHHRRRPDRSRTAP